MKILPKLIIPTLLGATLLGVSACSQSDKSASSAASTGSMNMPATSPKPAISVASMKFKPYLPHPYPFGTDPVSGVKLGADAIAFTMGDYQVKVANQADEDAFKKNSDAYLEKIKMNYADAKPDPLTTCPVCGMDLDESDLPFVYEGRQFVVCDASCLSEFQKDPDQYVKIWDDAENKAATAKK